MKRTFLIIIMLSLSGLFACAKLSPGTQKKLEATQSAVKHDSYPNRNGQQLWEVGQWSLYKTNSISREGIFRLFDSNLNKGFVQILIAAREGDLFWLELRIVASDKEQHIAALVAEEMAAGEFKYNIKQLKFTDNNQIIPLTQAELNAGAGEERQSEINIWLNFILHATHQGALRNVMLPAGYFSHVREVPITMSLWLGQLSGYVWYHNAVPVFPVVKFELTTSTTQWSNITETAELVDFGSAGKQSYFSYE